MSSGPSAVSNGGIAGRSGIGVSGGFGRRLFSGSWPLWRARARLGRWFLRLCYLIPTLPVGFILRFFPSVRNG